MEEVNEEIKTLERENKNLKDALIQAKSRETNLNTTLNNFHRVNKDLNLNLNSNVNSLNKSNQLNLNNKSVSMNDSRMQNASKELDMNSSINNTSTKYKYVQKPVTKWLNHNSVPDKKVNDKDHLLLNEYSRDEFNMMDQNNYMENTDSQFNSNTK